MDRRLSRVRDGPLRLGLAEVGRRFLRLDDIFITFVVVFFSSTTHSRSGPFFLLISSPAIRIMPLVTWFIRFTPLNYTKFSTDVQHIPNVTILQFF